MESLKDQILTKIANVVNVLLLMIPFSICWHMKYAQLVSVPFYNRGNWLVIILFAIIYISYAKLYDAFDIMLSRISEVISSQALALLISNGIMYIVMVLLMKKFPSILPLLTSYFVEIMVCVVWSVMTHKVFLTIFTPKITAVIYDMRNDVNEMVSSVAMRKRFNVVKTFNINDVFDQDMETFREDILEGIENLFLAGIHSHQRNIILKLCVEKNIKVFVIPRIGDVIMSGARRMHMFHLPMLQVGRYNPGPEYLLIKRILDIVICTIAFVILSPVFLIVAFAIKLTDHGPVFYKQCRLTKNGKKFNVLKFRSMRVDAEKDGIARLSTGDNDDRITAVGKVIRKFRLDELPQLINIIKGDMSIVGPRPERPEIAQQYEEELPEFALRLQAKAGLTGYAQVYGKYNTTPYDKLMMDLMYISNPSIVEDFKIMFATVKILFEAESTEGVEAGQTTASKE